MIRKAILASKDVYVEKPLCLSEAEGAELVDLARDRGRILMVDHLLWHQHTALAVMSTNLYAPVTAVISNDGERGCISL